MSESEVPDKVQSTPAKDLGEKESENFLAGKRILVADDDVGIGALVADLLTLDYGASSENVEVATDGREAQNKFLVAANGESPFNMIVTDLEMPGGSGWELAEAVRHFESNSSKPKRQIPILLMSGNFTKADLRRGMVGVRLMQKPLGINTLEQHLRQMAQVSDVGEDPDPDSQTS